MKTSRLVRSALLAAITALSAAYAFADVVETKSGARITGKVVKIDAGSVVVDTSYAGAITIKQSEVTAINTDAPVAIRLASGTRFDGTVSSTDGVVKITNSDGTVNTTVDKVAASWAAGGKDPQIVALERHWAYEATMDVAGTSGNKSQLSTSAAVRATLAGVSDSLAFYSAYDRQVTDGTKSADKFKAGVDYSNNFSGNTSWYVRDEGGFDRIKGIQFYDVAAFGIGYDAVKTATHTLTLRVGLAYRNENYTDPQTTDVNSMGLDFGLNNEVKFTYLSLVDRLTFVPSFNDMGNFRAAHESFLEFPLANPNWKLRFGLNNDYNSQPGLGVKKLDSGYFSRLVLDWK